MGVKKDCCNYDKKQQKCGALNDTYCQKEGCRFYKNAEVAKRQRQKCEERLEKIEKGQLFPPFPREHRTAAQPGRSGRTQKGTGAGNRGLPCLRKRK